MENNKLHKPDFRIETEEKNFADVARQKAKEIALETKPHTQHL